MEEFIKEIDSRIVLLQQDPTEINIAKVAELTLVNKRLRAFALNAVSHRRELLPDFLYESDGIIRVGVYGDSAVTDEWNDYLKKSGNCG